MFILFRNFANVAGSGWHALCPSCRWFQSSSVPQLPWRPSSPQCRPTWIPLLWLSWLLCLELMGLYYSCWFTCPHPHPLLEGKALQVRDWVLFSAYSVTNKLLFGVGSHLQVPALGYVRSSNSNHMVDMGAAIFLHILPSWPSECSKWSLTQRDSHLQCLSLSCEPDGCLQLCLQPDEERPFWAEEAGRKSEESKNSGGSWTAGCGHPWDCLSHALLMGANEVFLQRACNLGFCYLQPKSPLK